MPPRFSMEELYPMTPEKFRQTFPLGMVRTPPPLPAHSRPLPAHSRITPAHSRPGEPQQGSSSSEAETHSSSTTSSAPSATKTGRMEAMVRFPKQESITSVRTAGTGEEEEGVCSEMEGPIVKCGSTKRGGSTKKAAAASSRKVLSNLFSAPPRSGRPFKGVRRRKWGRCVCEIRDAIGKRIWLGSYDTQEEAARVYDAAARILQGEGAWLNFPHESSSGVTLPEPILKALWEQRDNVHVRMEMVRQKKEAESGNATCQAQEEGTSSAIQEAGNSPILPAQRNLLTSSPSDCSAVQSILDRDNAQKGAGVFKRTGSGVPLGNHEKAWGAPSPRTPQNVKRVKVGATGVGVRMVASAEAAVGQVAAPAVGQVAAATFGSKCYPLEEQQVCKLEELNEPLERLRMQQQQQQQLQLLQQQQQKKEEEEQALFDQQLAQGWTKFLDDVITLAIPKEEQQCPILPQVDQRLANITALGAVLTGSGRSTGGEPFLASEIESADPLLGFTEEWDDLCLWNFNSLGRVDVLADSDMPL